MKKIYDKQAIELALTHCKYSDLLYALAVPLFLIEYEPGESISSPLKDNTYFQIILTGDLSIYFIRDDGSSYSLSTGGADYIIGEMDLFTAQDNVFAEALDKVCVIAIDSALYRQQLLNHIPFMQMIASVMAQKIAAIMNDNAVHSSLSHRVLNYMLYICKDQTLSGIEKAAFKLHCSSRQLQRILNDFVKDGIIEKIGKGSYQIKD